MMNLAHRERSEIQTIVGLGSAVRQMIEIDLKSSYYVDPPRFIDLRDRHTAVSPIL
jgi:hypothetical protein